MNKYTKRLVAASLATLLTLQSLSPVLAYTEGTSGSSSSGGSSSGGSSSGGTSSEPSPPAASTDTPVSGIEIVVDETESGSDGDTYIGNGCNCNCNPLDPYTTYHPKVTILHNVNSLIAQIDKKSMYYIPTLNDLPFDLGETALSVKEKDGTEHKFALVYKDLFDAEAAYSTNKSVTTTDKNKNYATFHTSKDLLKDVNTGSVAVNTIGTDILLTKEVFSVKKKGSSNEFGYTPYVAGTADLNGSQVVMDLYKALGVFEYRVQYTFSQDEDWDTNSSPILQEIDFITDKADTDGIDISESRCDVSVSRTWSPYYWTRFRKDGVNVGKQVADNNSLSDITHVDTSLSKTKSVSLAQFVNCAAALMNLYGEAAVTQEQLDQFNAAYPMLMATSGELTELEQNSLKYLVIKGIISADELINANWHSPVHLLSAGNDDSNSIITWLGRIASPDSRLTMKEAGYVPPTLADAGYASASIELSDADVSELVVQSQNDLQTYDLLIEYTNPAQGNATRSVYTAFTAEVTTDAAVHTISNFSNKGSPEQTLVDDDDPNADILAESNSVNNEDLNEALQDIGLLTATGLVRLTNMTLADSISDLTSDKKNQYYYMGTQTFDGKSYYHFKIGKNVTAKAHLKFLTPTSTLESSLYYLSVDSEGKLQPVQYKDENGIASSFTVDSSLTIDGGGVIPLGQTMPVTFESEGFDRSFVDANSLAKLPLIAKENHANEQYIYSFYVKPKTLMNYLEKSSKNSNGMGWEALTENGKIKTNENITIQPKSKKFQGASITALVESAKNKKNEACYFVQILTNSKEAVESWSLIKKKSKKNQLYLDSENNTAYVKTTDDGKTYTMISCERLKSAGYITSFQEVSEDVLVLTAGSYENNIVINSDRKFIITGNTLILPNNRESIVLYTKDKDLGWLVCLEACLGWSGSYSYLRDSSNATIITNDTMYGYDATSQTNSLKQVTTMFPRSTTKAMWTDYSKDNFSGFNLCSTYVLAPYLVVMDMSAGSSLTRNDYLFVWHRQNAVKSNGKAIKASKRRDKYAREKFASLIALPNTEAADPFESVDSEIYALSCFKLNVTTKKENVNKVPDKSTENYLKGFTYHQLKRKGCGKDETVTSGWVYTPPEFKSITDALDAYARSITCSYYKISNTKGESSDQDKVDLAIPIFKYENVYYDANVNFTGTAEGEYLPVGNIAGKVLGSSSKGDIITIGADGKYSKSTSVSSADGHEVFTAPVAQFAALKGMGTASINELVTGTIYFGTSRCRLINGKVSFGDMSSSLPTDVQAIVSYLSTGNSTVYVISTGTSALSDVLNKVNTVLEYTLTDPDNLVDWTNYRMQRTLAGADAWSSVALLFVLQILPRIVGLLFMLLLILSLIKDWKPWQRLCHNTFDVYKFLTLGHQTVDTIDMKRMFIISLICSILMVMIYTGTLFEFMMFIAKFFIALYQH